LAKFPHYTKLQKKIKIKNKLMKSINILLHGTYLFMSENRRRWLCLVGDTCRPMLLKQCNVDDKALLGNDPASEA
jgi:hypothetical protein